MVRKYLPIISSNTDDIKLLDDKAIIDTSLLSYNVSKPSDNDFMDVVGHYHNDAMNYAEEAYIYSMGGDKLKYFELSMKAYELEKKAAEELILKFDYEPSRSIMFRSAASLALDCGLFREAERLLAAGLMGYPPEEIADELRDMLENVNLGRHLELRGVQLASSEFQFSINGSSVGYGLALSDAFIDRVQTLEKVLYRTAERKMGRDFREKGKLPKLIADNYPVFLSIPRARSFAVSFKIGHPTDQLNLDFPSIDTSADIINDVVDNFELLNRNEDDLLKNKFTDEAYFNNFISLAKQLAPDGKYVSQVGFTLLNGQKEKRVSVTRTQKNMPVITTKHQNSSADERVKIKGVLLYASSMGKNKTIKLKDESGNKFDVRVPPGMMGDIVRPLFEDTVYVEGIRNKLVIELANIWKAEE